MKHVLVMLLLWIEMAIIAVVGVAVTRGRFDDNPALLVYLFGIVTVLAAATAFGLHLKTSRRLTVHGALVVGCAIFAFPFVWLIGTSAKYPEETFVYPPKWIPSIPPRVDRSPYTDDDLFSAIERPTDVDADRWTELWPRLDDAIWRQAVQIQPDLRNWEGSREHVVHGLWVTVSPGVALAAWKGDDNAIENAVVSRIDRSAIDGVWWILFRSVALRDFTVKDVRMSDLRLDATATFVDRWRPVEGAITIDPTGGQAMLQYDWSAGDRVSIAGDFPLPVLGNELYGLTFPVRQDRSWHRMKFTIELDGKRYVPEDDLNLSGYRWGELRFKFKHLSDSDEREIGIWPLVLAKDQTDAFDEPGEIRVSFGVERGSRLATAWRKYVSNFRAAYVATPFWWDYVRNSLYLVVMRVVGGLISCSMVAYAFARLKWPGRDVLFFILLATMMLPAQVTMIPVFIIFKNLGWYNTLKPLWVGSFFGAAFSIFMLRQFMKGVPRELEEAAKLDGCSLFGIYWRIILPLMRPALAAVAIGAFMGTWNDFLGPLIYLNDQRLYPLALGLYDFRQQYGADFGLLMAASTLMTLPVILLFFLAQRYFIQGVTLTGMKN